MQVFGGDDASTSSVGSSSKSKWGIFASLIKKISNCCIIHSRDEDVLEHFQESKKHPHRRYGSNSKIYASVHSPFNLVPKQKKSLDNQLLSSPVHGKTLLNNDNTDIYQPLILNPSSPKVQQYDMDITDDRKYDDDDKDDNIVQGYNNNVLGFNLMNTPKRKQLASKKWRDIIIEESDKVNQFYLNIEHQLLAEYKQISFKIGKLYKQIKIQIAEDSIQSQSRATGPGPDSPATPLSNSSINQKDVPNSSKLALLEPLKIPKSHKKRNIHLYQMKLNIFILYQRFIALSNFRTLNQIGFKKILKKYDKNIKCFTQKKIIFSINKLDFIESKQCNECMNELIQAYSNLFEDGDFHRAKVRLLDATSWNKWSTSSSFLVGLKIGVLIGLIGWTASALFSLNNELPANAVYAYRSIGAFLSFLWFWSGDIYIWSKYRINYVFIFEFEPRTRLTFLQYFDEAATLTLIYFINCVLFIKSIDFMPREYVNIWPTSLIIFFILRLFLPLFEHWTSRRCMIDAMIQTIISPFGRVRFRDFFMGDVLTSCVKVLADFYLAICVLSFNEYNIKDGTGYCIDSSATNTLKPIIICAPYWFRFMQCLNRYFVTHDRIPHLPNALKYGTAMSVTLLGTLHTTYGHDVDGGWSFGRVIWLGATVISTCYLIFWDIFMDWKLGQKNRIKEYPSPWYILACINDVCLRYLWTFTLFPTSANPYFHSHFGYLNTAYFLAFIEIAELFRRAAWSVFRVENAHVSRKDEFRSYEFVPLFYEHTSLMEQQRKKNKPTSMILEVVSVFLLVLVVTIIVVLTQ